MQALLQYEQSASVRRAEVQRLLNNLTVWRLGIFIDDGVLELPRGTSIVDLRWEWQGVGIPWIDPLKEAKAEISLIEAGLASKSQRRMVGTGLKSSMI